MAKFPKLGEVGTLSNCQYIVSGEIHWMIHLVHSLLHRTIERRPVTALLVDIVSHRIARWSSDKPCSTEKGGWQELNYFFFSSAMCLLKMYVSNSWTLDKKEREREKKIKLHWKQQLWGSGVVKKKIGRRSEGRKKKNKEREEGEGDKKREKRR